MFDCVNIKFGLKEKWLQQKTNVANKFHAFALLIWINSWNVRQCLSAINFFELFFFFTMPYSKQRNSLLEREKEFLFVSISLEYKRCHFHFRRIQYYIRILSIFFLSLPHKFQALLRYEFIGNLIKILKCIILLCKHCTTLEMEREQMRLPINQMNIDVDYNKYKQTNLCKMYRIIDEKMVANSPINSDFFNAYTTHTSVTAPYFLSVF